jgi:hypothetical protein
MPLGMRGAGGMEKLTGGWTGTEAEEVRKEIRALKGLVLNRWVCFLFPFRIFFLCINKTIIYAQVCEHSKCAGKYLMNGCSFNNSEKTPFRKDLS